MENIVEFFKHIESWQRTIILVAGLLLFWALESFIPLFRFSYDKYRHAGVNLFFTFTTVAINLAFAFLIVRASTFTSIHHVGLLYIFRLPTWLFIISGLMILDLTGAWFIHWLQHKVRWMWKFHVVHHCDQHVNTTTANRHHPGESIFRAVFTLLAVLISGAPVWLLFLYQSLSVLIAQFNHANISLPRTIDNILSWVIVSPDMHKVHHHHQQPLTDSNYGNLFSFWDRLTGNFISVSHMSSLKYGIDSHNNENDNEQLTRLLKIPFEPYRAREGSTFKKKLSEKSSS
jgi:sterol desaturase/sphingolipid hydroxylase (fatty acid hydroxylase superfamily)